MDKTGETSSDETLGMRATKSPQLCGAYISEFGPIRQQYLDLAPGLNCLYGVNGAGKSQILSCLVKSLENSKDLISSDYSGRGDALVLSGAALVYRASDFGAYENPISRMWSENSMGDGSGLPNRDDILVAHDYDGMARSSEFEQNRITNEPNAFEDHLELIERTIDFGRLVLFPRPDKNAFQIIYAISVDCEDLEFKNFTSEFVSQMKNAAAVWAQADFDDQEEHFPDRIAELKGNPLVNAFNVQGHLTDQYVAYYAEHWNEKDFNFPIQNFPFIPISSLGFVSQAPTSLYTEDSIDDIEVVNRRTRYVLLESATENLHNECSDDQDCSAWEHEDEISDDGESPFMVQVNFAANELQTTINRLLNSFLSLAPNLRLEVGSRRQWFLNYAPSWEIGKTIGQSLGKLSFAQQRWVRLALDLGFRGSRLVARLSNHYQERQLLIIDEPERGLHRVGESHLASGLVTYAEDTGTALIATHSPSFLNLPSANVSLVSDFRISHLAALELDALDQLGLHPSDLLMTYKVFWLVEGQHEIAIFETLFGETLRNERIKLLPLRGAKSLSSVVDSTLLFEFTKAKIVLTLDNLNGPLIQDAWGKAVAESAEGRPINKVRDDLAQVVTSKSGEGRQLLEFMSNCLINQVQERVTLTALSKKDIIEYFDPKEFGLTNSWRELHEMFAKTREFKNFKEFLIGTFGVRISSSLLSELASVLTEIPTEFQACLETVLITAILLRSRPF